MVHDLFSEIDHKIITTIVIDIPLKKNKYEISKLWKKYIPCKNSWVIILLLTSASFSVNSISTQSFLKVSKIPLYGTWSSYQKNQIINEMVFCFQNCSTFEIRSWRPRISKSFEVTRTIYLRRDRSEQFSKQDALLTCSWRFLRSTMYFGTTIIQILKNNWNSKT